MTGLLGWVGVLAVLLGLAVGNLLAVVPGMLMLSLLLLVRLSTSQAIRSGIRCQFELARSFARPQDTIDARLILNNDQPFPVFWLGYSVEWPAGVCVGRWPHTRGTKV